jgi:hypothetical protein
LGGDVEVGGGVVAAEFLHLLAVLLHVEVGVLAEVVVL